MTKTDHQNVGLGSRVATLRPSLLVASCGLESGGALPLAVGPGQHPARSPNSRVCKITVGSKDFTEQIMLGYVIEFAMAAAGADVRDLTEHPGLQQHPRRPVERPDRPRLRVHRDRLDQLPRQRDSAPRLAGAVRGRPRRGPRRERHGVDRSGADEQHVRTGDEQGRPPSRPASGRCRTTRIWSQSDPAAASTCVGPNSMSARTDSPAWPRNTVSTPAGCPTPDPAGPAHLPGDRRREPVQVRRGAHHRRPHPGSGSRSARDDRHFFPKYNAGTGDAQGLRRRASAGRRGHGADLASS